MNILTVDGLCKHYPGFTLDHVSFSMEAGTVMGFIGRNGAGKTTTLKALLRLVHPDAGKVSRGASTRRGTRRSTGAALRAFA